MFKDVSDSIWDQSIKAFRFYEILNLKKKGGFTPNSAKFKFWAK